MSELAITGPGPTLSATRGGPEEGAARVVMLHGLTATRHYTVMGSRHLDRRGIVNVAYDARGHGHSGRAAGPGEYTYPDLAADLQAVVEAVTAPQDQVVLLGISMGAHTAVRYALDHPQRVAGLVLITPAHLPGPQSQDRSAWHALAASLRGPDPIEAFVVASGLETLPEAFREQVAMAIRQRIGRHDDLSAVADALEGVPASSPFDAIEDLQSITAPSIVVGSRDEVDPSHPLAVAQRWTDALPDARLEVEEAGKSPLAWQGGRLARFAEELVANGT
ncbi:MAG: alpha/beta fold hydrolase [Solirubrobacteraceae bacterium]|nr:alpha/beta fold hydrolase [Solirubrobacteraceae bacterium]